MDSLEKDVPDIRFIDKDLLDLIIKSFCSRRNYSLDLQVTVAKPALQKFLGNDTFSIERARRLSDIEVLLFLVVISL